MEVNLIHTSGGTSGRVNRTELIKSFLEEKTLPDLAALYSHDMECQVIVSRGNGEVIRAEYRGKEYQAYTDGTQRWKSFRVPYRAGTTPEYDDKPIGFDLHEHAEGIGMTGWNWKEQKSIYVAFDFDSMVTHSSGLTDLELADILHKVEDIPWVTVRKSTSGRGYHLYVFLEPVETANHHEHAALARAILSKMSALAGTDFSTKVDICGGNMWVWHTKMYGEDGKIIGYECVKQGTILSDIPVNWRAHIRVAKKMSRSADLKLPDVEEADLDNVLNERALIPLDEEHTRLIRALDGTESWWDADHHLLVTHTWSLKQAHEALELKGVYDTVSTGTAEGQDHNCFALPRRNGSWIVRRYSQVAENPPWYVDRYGFSCCDFNCEPDMESLARALGGIETERRGFLFPDTQIPEQILQLLKSTLGLPRAIDREVTMRVGKNGRLIIKIKRDAMDDKANFPGFEANKDSTWTKILRDVSTRSEEVKDTEYDHLLRHIVSTSGDSAGWVITTNERFINEPLVHVNLAMKARGLSGPEVIGATGAAILSPWFLVNIPFEKEYPGERRWNRDAPQLLFALNEDRDALYYPTWMKILNHCGTGLNSAVRKDSWCQEHGLENGADYLKCWCASLFQEPAQPLPYLFFFGPQNSGKSIFHEALGVLFSPGYMKADNALTSTQSFNGELQNAILCAVEETDLSHNKSAYNKIKDYVTAPQLAIRPLYQTTFLVTNMTHWVQCANEQRFCPILPGDTRVVIVEVPEIKEIIPKRQMMDALRAEASDFLTEMMRMTLPPSPDRLNVPPIRTEAKDTLENANRNELQVFLEDSCYEVPGESIPLAALYETFLTTINTAQAARWSKIRMTRELPSKFPKGRHPSGKHIVGNISFEKEPSAGNDGSRRWMKTPDSDTLKLG